MADEDSWLYGEEGGGEENVSLLYFRRLVLSNRLSAQDEGEAFKEGDAGQDEPMGEEPQAATEGWIPNIFVSGYSCHFIGKLGFILVLLEP